MTIKKAQNIAEDYIEDYSENNILEAQVANALAGREEINIAEKNSVRTNHITPNYFSALSPVKSPAEKAESYKK